MVPNSAWDNIYLYLNKFHDFSTGYIKEKNLEIKTTLFKCQEMQCVLIYKYILQVPISLSLKYLSLLSSSTPTVQGHCKLFPHLNTVGTWQLTNHPSALQSTRLKRSKMPY